MSNSFVQNLKKEENAVTLRKKDDRKCAIILPKPLVCDRCTEM